MAYHHITVAENGAAIRDNSDFSLDVPNQTTSPFIDGANLVTMLAMFEAIHGATPVLAGKNMVNPPSLNLSAEMLLCHLGCTEAVEQVEAGVSDTISQSQVTCEPAEIIGLKALSCSDYAAAVIQHM